MLHDDGSMTASVAVRPAGADLLENLRPLVQAGLVRLLVTSGNDEARTQALVASLLAYVCYNAAVAQVGPVHAGLSINLIPAFATLLALLFLGEQLHGFHLTGMLMIALGLWLAASSSVRPAPARQSS